MPKLTLESNHFDERIEQQIQEEKASLPLESRDLKEVSPEFIRAIEVSKLYEDDKVNLLLTARGLKPASIICILLGTKTEKGESSNISEDDMEDVMSIFEESGLPFSTGIVESPASYIETGKPEATTVHARILVGITQKDLNVLEKVIESEKDVRELLKNKEINEATKKEITAKHRKELGFALGFPPTAIEAYAKTGKDIIREDLPKEEQGSDGVLFSSFALSKENWREEIKLGKTYAEYIKSISPGIYKEYVDFRTESKGEDSLVIIEEGEL